MWWWSLTDEKLIVFKLAILFNFLYQVHVFVNLKENTGLISAFLTVSQKFWWLKGWVGTLHLFYIFVLTRISYVLWYSSLFVVSESLAFLLSVLSTKLYSSFRYTQRGRETSGKSVKRMWADLETGSGG